MRSFKVNRSRAIVIQRAFPARHAHAPLVTRLQSGEAPFQMRRDKVVSIEHREIEKFPRDFHTDRMKANVFGARSTKSVPIKSGHRISATTFQFSSKNIRRHKERLRVSIRKTLAKETIMPIRAEYVTQI